MLSVFRSDEVCCNRGVEELVLLLLWLLVCVWRLLSLTVIGVGGNDDVLANVVVVVVDVVDRYCRYFLVSGRQSGDTGSPGNLLQLM